MEEMKQMIQRLLGIPNINILSVEIDPQNQVSITVESTMERTICHQCGRDLTAFHSLDDPIRLRHLPMLGHKTYIIIRPKRYLCEHCPNQPKTTQKPDWYSSKSRCTKAYEQHLLLSLVNSTVQDVSRKEAIGYKTVEAVVERLINEKVDWERIKQLRPKILGIDEIARLKGRQNYVTIITLRLADGAIIVLAVLADRKKETVKEFLKLMPEEVKKKIKTVCTDMYRGFTEAAKEELSGARLVVDRFHVAKMYREDADDLRKSEMRRLKKELSEEDYGELKGVMWVFRKNEADLPAEEQAQLEKLFSYSPALEKTYRFREELTAIFEKKQSKKQAKKEINQWQEHVRRSGLKCFDKFLKTLDEWMEEITNYFVKRNTSGFVEGLNNKIKVLKRRCYGIPNVVHFFKRIILDIEGYRMFATN